MKKSAFYRIAGVLFCVCLSFGMAESVFASGDSTGLLTPTDKLTICVEEESMTFLELLPVTERFRELYPEIELEIVGLPVGYSDADIPVRQATVEQIKTEVMRGEGPDLFVMPVGTQISANGSVVLFPDLEKTARAGIFADLGEMIEADGTLDMEKDFYSFVESAGTIGGTFCVFPLSFFATEMNVTTEEKLKSSGIDVELANSSAKAYTEEMNRCLTADQRLDTAVANFENLSYGLLDYDTGEIRMGEEERWYFEHSQEYRKYYQERDNQQPETYDEKIERLFRELLDGDNPVAARALRTDGGITFAEYMAAEGQDAVFWLLPDEKGGSSVNIGSYAAVNANSPNKGNAMEFIKLLVSEEMQGQGSYPCGTAYLPVRKGEEVLRSAFQVYRDTFGFSYLMPAEEISETSMESLMSELDRVTTGKLMAAQIYYIPLEGEKTFNDYYAEYLQGAYTYEEFADIVRTGLEFYWAE